MTGTSSRTTTAYDGGTTRHTVVEGAFLHEPSAMPRGYVERKLEAKLWSEEHKSHMRRSSDGRGRVGVQSPTVIRLDGRICGGYVERKSRALPREICLSASESEREKRKGASLVNRPGRPAEHAAGTERTACHAEIRSQAREAARSTKDRQKSAESISCQRMAAKEEHMESNRNGAFDA